MQARQVDVEVHWTRMSKHHTAQTEFTHRVYSEHHKTRLFQARKYYQQRGPQKRGRLRSTLTLTLTNFSWFCAVLTGDKLYTCVKWLATFKSQKTVGGVDYISWVHCILPCCVTVDLIAYSLVRKL